MKFKWTYDKGGDWQLEEKGEYVGMICPHKEYLQVIADGRRLIGPNEQTISAYKIWLERWWKLENKVRKYRKTLWKSF